MWDYSLIHLTSTQSQERATAGLLRCEGRRGLFFPTCVKDAGVAHAQLPSSASKFLPRSRRKYPISPQYSPQLFRMIQYFKPLSVVPQPTMDTMWLISYAGLSVKIPPLL